MIRLFSLKQQKKDGEAVPKAGTHKKASAAQLRITKDINELNLPKTCNTEFPDPDDLLSFKLIICPDEGFYRGGRFSFSFKVGLNYPHEPPKVKCETAVYHPNIDLEGNVCLNILREDWKPVLTINSIVYGLQYLFLVAVRPCLPCGSAKISLIRHCDNEDIPPNRIARRMNNNTNSNENYHILMNPIKSVIRQEPNPEDPLNKEAAEVLQNNRRLFEANVQKAMRGGYVGTVYFDRCLK